MGHITVEKRAFSTIGFGCSNKPQMHCIVWLITLEGKMKLWEENSIMEFSSHNAKDMLPAAQRYARKASKLLGFGPPVTWSAK